MADDIFNGGECEGAHAELAILWVNVKMLAAVCVCVCVEEGGGKF